MKSLIFAIITVVISGCGTKPKVNHCYQDGHNEEIYYWVASMDGSSYGVRYNYLIATPQFNKEDWTAYGFDYVLESSKEVDCIYFTSARNKNKVNHALEEIADLQKDIYNLNSRVDLFYDQAHGKKKK